ncbi:MAG: DUF3488 domain-containing protein, partial [Halomonadaceae bacterium]
MAKKPSNSGPETGYFAPRALDCLLAGFALVLLAQLNRLPWWLTGLALIAALAGWFIRRRGRRPLSKTLLLSLTLVTVAGFWVVYRGQYTVDTAASFFVLTVALKWLELRQRRDLFVLFFILCYLVTVTLLFQDSILWTLLLLLVIFLLFNGLQQATAGASRQVSWDSWRRSGWLFLKALPVVVILFVFFPRMGPLWSVPLVSEQAVTGLSEEMSPGEITNLAQNSQRAFRVQFGGDTPPPAQRYWRALILDRFDGRTWRRHSTDSPERVSRVSRGASGEQLPDDHYEVLMEPSYQRWGYALEGSISASPELTQDRRGLVSFNRSVDTSIRYRMQMQTQAFLGEFLNDEEHARYTQIPGQGNSRTLVWVAQQQALEPDPQALVNRFMEHFNQQPYHYTLRPAALGADPVDELLFETYQGFCEHYA